jgi:hypothetical protein
MLRELRLEMFKNVFYLINNRGIKRVDMIIMSLVQIYDGKGWLLSTEHILYTLGHQKFMLKDFAAAAEFFNDLMAVSSGMNPLQQMVHLREFFLVHHARLFNLCQSLYLGTGIYLCGIRARFQHPY